jgi:glycosyltransferase involved in cell wall biosynthesis
MKLLYITPIVNDEGGLPRVLSIKTNYLVDNLDYEISILTQNNGYLNPFFEFNKKIEFFDMKLNANKFIKFFLYKKALNQHIKNINPDLIIVCDFGIKGFLIPFIVNTKIPILFEAHGSLYNESSSYKLNLFSKYSHKFKYAYRAFCTKKFDYFVALSNESLKEWNVKNGKVIPNPNWFKTTETALLQSKKALMIARHSHEKGLDRIVPIWKKVVENHADWKLEIYGKSSENQEIEILIKSFDLENNISLFEPIKNVQEKYLDASMYLMSSRTEAFPMVLIEALSSGLPCIAYDCPVGPRAIIENNKNGFLIEDENENEFVNAICNLINNQNLRLQMGKNAKISSEKYNLDVIMQNWDKLFKETV